jgi:hypothetical protein
VLSFILVVAGPTLAEKAAVWFHLGSAFEWTWKIVQWPVVFALISLAMALVYYDAPDAEQDWVWITPGSLLATALWMARRSAGALPAMPSTRRGRRRRRMHFRCWKGSSGSSSSIPRSCSSRGICRGRSRDRF